MKKYSVTGMNCAACQARVEKAVADVPGVDECSVSLLTNSMTVSGEASDADITSAVEKAGYGASRLGASAASNTDKVINVKRKAGGSYGDFMDEERELLKDRTTPQLIKRLVSSAGFLIILMYFSMGHTMLHLPLPKFFIGNYVAAGLMQMILASVVMLINKEFFTSGFRSLLHGAPNMDTLVALGSMTSFAWSVAVLFGMSSHVAAGNFDAAMRGMHNLYFESAAMIVTLITVGKMLESISKGRTTDALKGLMKLMPETATVVRDGAEVEIRADEVAEGEIFVVRPGDKVPADGMIIEGSAAVDESALTGESIPVDKGEGETLSAATVNLSGFVKARAERVGADTTLSQIIRMVSDAAGTKAPIAKMADKVAGVFVPAVMVIAVSVMVIWLLIGQDTGYALARGIAVLVISCPCALGLATPVAIMVGSGKGAKNGILFKTAASLESAGRVQVVALDKTGTITKGKPEVTDVIALSEVDETELEIIATSLEYGSEHPLAHAISEYGREKGVPVLPVDEFEALPGHGLRARLRGEEVLAGNAAFVGGKVKISGEAEASAERLAESGKTPVFFAKNGKLSGIIAVADTVKEDSAEAVARLKRMGIMTVMLTGDNAKTASAIGGKTGVDEIISEVLPGDKAAKVAELGRGGVKVAMVGDGINDAPALTAADVGIAIGGGTDIAVDAADVVLVDSALSNVPAAIYLGRKTLGNIKENLFWAFFYNVLMIPLAAGVYVNLLGWSMNPMWGAAAMSLSSFCVCMNALRLNLLDIYESGGKAEREIAEPEAETVCPAALDKGKQNKLCKEGETVIKTIKVEGMMCGHCEKTVKDALEAIDGVKSAEVSHEQNSARLELANEVSDDTIAEAVADKGYKLIR